MEQCCICGRSFTLKVANQITCSLPCRLKRKKEYKISFDLLKNEAECVVCKQIFFFPKSSKRVNCSECLSNIRSTNKLGHKNKSWRGGVSEKNRTEKQNFMSTREWKSLRVKVFQRDDYTCQICFVKGGTLNADHIKPYLLYPDLRSDINNIRTLCVFCHRKTDTYGCKIHINYAKNT